VSRTRRTLLGKLEFSEGSGFRYSVSLAIWEGRECARGVDQYLMGHTDLPASPDPF